MAATGPQDEWIARVLGVRAAPSAPPAGSGSDVLTIWRAAKDPVAARLDPLASARRAEDDPDLERIADFGLSGIGSGESVALTKAMFEFRAAPPDKRAALGGKLHQAVGSFRAVIDSRLVQTIDDNPFDIEIGIRATLGDALNRIERELT